MGQEDPLENGIGTHSSILAWKIPWTEEPGGLQSMESQESFPTLQFKSINSSLQLCPTLCDSVDGSLPGASLHGIVQARILE